MKYAWLSLLLWGCASAPKTRPYEIDVVGRCDEVLTLADNLFPTDRYAFVAEHCAAPIIREPTCRAAVMQSLLVDASTRSRRVADACTKAYCPAFEGDKPALCTTDFEQLSAAAMRPMGLELFTRIREFELGPVEAQRWEAVIGQPNAPTVAVVEPTPEPPKPAKVEPPKPEPKPAKVEPPKPEPKPAKVEPPKPEPKPAKVEPPKPEPKPAKVEPPKPEPKPAKVEPPKPEPKPAKVEPPKPEPKTAKVEPPKPEPKPTRVEPPKPMAAGAVTVALTVLARSLTVTVGSEVWNLSDKPASRAFDPIGDLVARLAGREHQVVIRVGDDIEYHHLVGVLNALGARGIKNIAIVNDP